MLRGPLRRVGNTLLVSIVVSLFFNLIIVGTGTAQSTYSRSEQAVEAASSEGLKIDFDHFLTGPVPNDFTPVLIGLGIPAMWEVRPEPSARSGQKVLAQTSTEEENFRFPLLLCSKLPARNVEVSVFFKPISGKIDQAAGIVVRYQDPARFYMARANALEGEVRLYKVVNGAEHPIVGANAQVVTGDWHWMKLIAHESHFQVYFNGVFLFEAEDETYDQAGQVGLLTKSDSSIVFDDLRIMTADGGRPLSKQ
jgi:hypothetical protein